MSNQIIPVCLIKNEEFYIYNVLRALTSVFPKVLVGDTGSTDATLEIVSRVVGVTLLNFGETDQKDLTSCRSILSTTARDMGADYFMVVDGDELYCRTSLLTIRDTPIPAGFTGFTRMLSIDRETNLDLWEMNDLFNRHCVSPVSATWEGTYPYDVPSSYNDPSKYFYYPLPDGFRYHAVHLHRLQRSRFDYNVVKRIEKQKLFCLKDLPIKRTIPFSILEWTRS